MRLPLLSILVGSMVTLSGCCSLARVFCGPDRSRWVPQAFDTPRHTAQTLFEALRREDPEVLFLCLAPSYRRAVGITDSMTMRLAWDRFVEQNPHLHVAGYTEVPEPTRSDPDHATVTVDVVGTAVDLDFVRLAKWELRYLLSDGRSVGAVGDYLPSFGERAQVAPSADEDRSKVLVAPFEFDHGADPVPIGAIEHVALTRVWLVAAVRTRP